VENETVKLKLFPFSLRGKAKDWLLSLPNGSINSWDNSREDLLKNTILLLKFCKIEIAYFLLRKMIMI
jgi:hypothetical protein